MRAKNLKMTPKIHRVLRNNSKEYPTKKTEKNKLFQKLGLRIIKKKNKKFFKVSIFFKN